MEESYIVIHVESQENFNKMVTSWKILVILCEV